jgi:hypothetical protein
MGSGDFDTAFGPVNLRGGGHFENVGADGNIILKRIFQQIECNTGLVLI